MSDDHALTEQQNRPGGETPDATPGWRRLLAPRALAIVVIPATLLAGLLLAGKLGPAGGLFPGIGLVIVVMLGRSLMYGGHRTHDSSGAPPGTTR